MNTRQEASLNMFDSVLAHCETNAAITSTVTAYSNAVANLKTTLSAIRSTMQQQLRSVKGITVSKAENRNSLSALTIEVAGAVFAYASDTANTILKDSAKLTSTALLRYKDEELGPRCSTVLKLAQDNKTALKEYGITDAVITSLQSAIDAYNSAVPAPRNAKAQNAAYRVTLRSLFKTAGSIVKEKLDKLTPAFKKDNQEFVTAYKANRIIIDPYSTVTQLKGSVTSSARGEPVKDAVIEIKELGITLKTDAKGSFAVKPLPFGEYSIEVSKEGFASQTIADVKITQGVINRLAVALK